MSLEKSGFKIEDMQVSHIFGDEQIDKKLTEYKFVFPDNQIAIPIYFIGKDFVEEIDSNKKRSLLKLLNGAIKNKKPLKQTTIDKYLDLFSEDQDLV